MQKYNFSEARPVLERASARETATRVALGVVAAQILKALGVELVSHTVAVGGVHAPEGAPVPSPRNVDQLDADRCAASTRQPLTRWFSAWTRRTRTVRLSVVWLRCSRTVCLLDWVRTCTGTAAWTRALLQPLMGIQAIKGVEVGDGFATADRPALPLTTRFLSVSTALPAIPTVPVVLRAA